MAVTVMLVIIASGTVQAEEKRLTLKDAIFHALKNNVDLQVQKSDTHLALESLKINKAIFIPNLNMSGNTEKQIRPSTNSLEGVDKVENQTKSLSFNITQRLPYGGSLSLAMGNSSQEVNTLNQLVSPYLSTYAGFQLEQALLKDGGKLATKYQIYISSNDLKISKFRLQEQLLQLIYDVESAYWELVYAYQNMETVKMAMNRAKDLLRQNEIKVKVGTAAPIEILSSKAEVARNESSLIQAERTIQTREENLKRILNMSKNNDALIPLDTPQVEAIKGDFNEFLLEALNNRLDIKRAKLDLESNNIRVRYAKNQVLPTLNLQATYYTYGRGGTPWIFPRDIPPYDPNFYRTPDEANKLTIWDAWNETFNMKNKNYSVSLNLRIPLWFAAEKAQLAQAKINLKKTMLQYESTENTVYSEVKEVIKELESNKKLVEAQKISEQLETENLKAEEKKLSVGLSTNFNVLDVQRRLADTQTAVLRSIIDFTLTRAKINRTLNRTFNEYGINFEEFFKD